jgi:hypothetical protein
MKKNVDKNVVQIKNGCPVIYVFKSSRSFEAFPKIMKMVKCKLNFE